MTETQWSSKLVHEIRQRMPEAVTWKHADGYSAGIPDISITTGRETLWAEIKLLNNPKIFEPLQLAILKRMHGHYIVWDTRTKLGARFKAEEVLSRAEVTQRCIYSFDRLVENILDEVR